MAKISLDCKAYIVYLSSSRLGEIPYPPERFASWLESIDMIAPMTIATLVAVGEMATGIGIILGGFISGQIGNLITRLSALGIFIIMIKEHFTWPIQTGL